MSKRPNIGLSKPRGNKINFPYAALWFSVWLGGGNPITLEPEEEPEEQIHGLMLGGGTDIFPGLFEEQPKEDYKYDQPRDELEIKWLKRANKENLPVFAICRGSQLMNVVRGGTLHMDISQVYQDANYPDNFFGYMFFRKKIRIEDNTLICSIFKQDEMRVNSLHKQSIDQLGEGLVVSAREPNGIVQAIERPDHPFYLGVQFHPELLIYQRSFRAFFRKFIGAAKAQAKTAETEKS